MTPVVISVRQFSNYVPIMYVLGKKTGRHTRCWYLLHLKNAHADVSDTSGRAILFIVLLIVEKSQLGWKPNQQFESFQNLKLYSDLFYVVHGSVYLKIFQGYSHSVKQFASRTGA